MQAATAINTGILLAVGLVLVLAAIEDMRTRRISNKLSIILIGLFVVRAAAGLVAGQEFMSAVGWPVVVGGSVLLIGLALFATRVMGGGDVKLLSTMALFAGPELGLSFVLYVTILGGIVALGLLAWNRWKQTSSPHDLKVPYGVAISAGGIWVCAYQISAHSI